MGCTTLIWGQEILHLKVRKFTTKVSSRHNFVQNFTRSVFRVLNFTLTQMLHLPKFVGCDKYVSSIVASFLILLGPFCYIMSLLHETKTLYFHSLSYSIVWIGDQFSLDNILLPESFISVEVSVIWSQRLLRRPDIAP